MKIRVVPYKFKNLQWWDYFDLACSFGVIGQTKMKKTQKGTWAWEHTGKLRGVHLHLHLLCWCVDLWLDIREDIEEESE